MYGNLCTSHLLKLCRTPTMVDVSMGENYPFGFIRASAQPLDILYDFLSAPWHASVDDKNQSFANNKVAIGTSDTIHPVNSRYYFHRTPRTSASPCSEFVKG